MFGSALFFLRTGRTTIIVNIALLELKRSYAAFSEEDLGQYYEHMTHAVLLELLENRGFVNSKLRKATKKNLMKLLKDTDTKRGAEFVLGTGWKQQT